MIASAKKVSSMSIPARHTLQVPHPQYYIGRPMEMDPCLALVQRVRDVKPTSVIQKAIARTLARFGIYSQTPNDRIEAAVKREVDDLIARASTDLSDLPAAREALDRGKAESSFPRQELRTIAAPLNGAGEKLWSWIKQHEQLERRVHWLVDPELTTREMDKLDPVADADQLFCYVRYKYRPELIYAAWPNSIERISQFEFSATFFHSTGKAEGIPAKRTEDTAIYYAYFHNWGANSWHGRKAIAGMNRIHGRYFIHNDGMKYVLLNGIFTVLDSFDYIGHVPLSEKERHGYFHAGIEMGRGMNIQNISHDYDEMYAWFQMLNKANAAFSAKKIRSWMAMEEQYDRDRNIPPFLTKFRRMAEHASMDDTYLSALGLQRPSKRQTAFVRGVMKTVAKLRSWLPNEPFIASLHNYGSYPEGVTVEDVGEKERSERMPSVCPFAVGGVLKPNKGYPENNKPLPGPEFAAQIQEMPTYTWEEVKKHDKEDDIWVVWGGHVYDMTPFAKEHPGGLKILLNGVGKDMTRAFEKAEHTPMTKVFALNFRIGYIESSVPKRTEPVSEQQN
jgi:hypothetical protein